MTERRRRRLLTIGHAYCVDLNRRLPQELARAGDWDVTAVAPARFRGDFGWHTTTTSPDERCRVVAVPVSFGRQVHVMRYGRALTTLLREPWDLVHCWEEPYVAAASQVARATSPGVPLVFATFQNILKRYPPPFLWFERRMFGRADGAIAFGQTSRDVLIRRGWRDRPIRVIPSGVDTGEFRPDAGRRVSARRALGWDGDDPVIGFVGRLVPDKGVGILTRVLDRLAAPWRLLVVGSGPLEHELRAWARRYPDRVRIQTSVSHHEVPPLLNAMDVLCAPSRTTAAWREQFGRMLIEAFASGVPVVASMSGEIPNVVADAGVLVAEDDVDAWTHAVGRVLGDTELRATLSQRGRDRALSVFAWPVVARQHLDYFDELTRGHA